MKELILGYGRVWVNHIMIPPDERHGILLRPVEKAHPINSKDPDFDGIKEYEAREEDVVIWCDNLEAARVLQDAVNLVCLELNGFSVDDKAHE